VQNSCRLSTQLQGCLFLAFLVEPICIANHQLTHCTSSQFLQPAWGPSYITPGRTQQKTPPQRFLCCCYIRLPSDNPNIFYMFIRFRGNVFTEQLTKHSRGTLDVFTAVTKQRLLFTESPLSNGSMRQNIHSASQYFSLTIICRLSILPPSLLYSTPSLSKYKMQSYGLLRNTTTVRVNAIQNKE
jgi:hypothetical protein